MHQKASEVPIFITDLHEVRECSCVFICIPQVNRASQKSKLAKADLDQWLWIRRKPEMLIEIKRSSRSFLHGRQTRRACRV
eukprot:3458334-Rhodomonas_salina.2